MISKGLEAAKERLNSAKDGLTGVGEKLCQTHSPCGSTSAKRLQGARGRVQVKFAGTTAQDTSGWGIYKTCKDLFLSRDVRDKMLMNGIQSDDLNKIRSDTGDELASGIATEKALADVYATKYLINLDHQIFTDHGVFHSQVLLDDLVFEIKLSAACEVVNGSEATKLGYKLTNIKLICPLQPRPFTPLLPPFAFLIVFSSAVFMEYIFILARPPPVIAPPRTRPSSCPRNFCFLAGGRVRRFFFQAQAGTRCASLTAPAGTRGPLPTFSPLYRSLFLP